MARRRWLPDNVTEYKDRHGKARYRFRKTGLPTYHFRHAPGTEGFREEYAKALKAVPEKLSRWKPGSYDELIESFYQTPRWLGMKDSSQTTYRGIIERFRAKNGDKDVRGATAASIERLLMKYAETPAAANNLRKSLARLHKHAIKLDWRKDNPVSATDPFKTKPGGHHTWTETEIEQFEKRWPLGTKERLAMTLLLWTALRRSDMVKLRAADRDGDVFRLHHGKNASDTVVPIVGPLADAIDGLSGEPAYLLTSFGKPYTGAGFGNWFREICNDAGLPHCSAHGLRKAMSRRLAESGSTNQQGKSVTGHKTDKEFDYYASQANKTDLAREAVANVAKRFAKRKKTSEENQDDK